MDAQTLYYKREDLMTIEEIEDMNYDYVNEEIPTLTPNLLQLLSDFGNTPSPEEQYKVAFLERKPALGATVELLDEARQHNYLLPAVQQRQLFYFFRGKMLGHLIPCLGASTLEELLNILQAELNSGIPSPVPDWYDFSTAGIGTRKIGYYKCDSRGCYNTETPEQPPFGRCGQCKIASYCSEECQKEDWKARHKQVCANAKKKRKTLKEASQMLDVFSQYDGLFQFE